MITFKQYLREEDETDIEHANVQEAAEAFVKHCSQFPDIDNPLYRISGSHWDGTNHVLKTRGVRTRRVESRGNSAKEQEFIFSQPAWKDYPPRRQSIFCSTTEDIMAGSADDDKGNLLIIYPFDGVKIALLDDPDLNFMPVLKGTTKHKDLSNQIDSIFDLVDAAFKVFYGTSVYDDDLMNIARDDHIGKLQAIKKYFNKNGKFDSEANGNDEIADRFAEWAKDDEYNSAEILELVATEIPEKLTPEAWGAKLVTSSGLDLPGDTRECWFSGKYLSIPYRYYDEFKAAVKNLRKSK